MESTKTRAEHLEWCKARARKYLDRGDHLEALASMVSDMSKHAETTGHPGIMLGMAQRFAGHLNSVAAVRHWVDGFN